MSSSSPAARSPSTRWQFMSILPAGSVTRRDGVLDIAAHTPRNANPPDLGPKGYFAQASDDRKGGKGTTKLHSASRAIVPRIIRADALCHSGTR